jgi:hypothetical protein
MMVAGLAGIPALAAPAASAAEGGLQWYFSAGIPVTNLETDSLVADAAALGVTATDELGDLAIGGQSTLGVMVTRNLGLEIRYSASGDARDTVRITNITAPPQSGSAKVSIDGLTAYAVGRWPLSEQVDLMGKLGYTSQDIEFDADLLTATIDDSDDDDGFAAGLGVRLSTGERWGVTAEIEYLGVDFDGGLDEPFRGSLNLEYLF